MIAFLCPDGVMPEVVLVQTDQRGKDLRTLTPQEWPHVTVGALSGRAGQQVRVDFTQAGSAALPGREEMAAIMLRWSGPVGAQDTPAGGDGHLHRRSQRAAAASLAARADTGPGNNRRAPASAEDLALALAAARSGRAGSSRRRPS
ncbi:hypothetical protein [Deinococcus soli (ex Cha et al. 2016)]|uniref:Uncharacterized protein n=2 Tax=Deinococcus soli (ex Cha et al. 2016) TaxID=1309411 RepID=A0ACC6KGQ2_9DEIO|nr:hypothetical protein [Deinococcus soli (ex Cha et al. 2016)]MDR6218127.1 hypothetical protein [Deinococcus soli (ex Cha et al. 2016)]MDR6328867.1 hypothetical protein [Deinococcus soli (ex Cha et al. 2016)]MDR6751645.1 hypothetical protein [Deinococcus soli (ex Cha et al. 2016)]